MSAALSAEREPKYLRCATALMETQRDSRSISIALQRRLEAQGDLHSTSDALQR